MLYYVFFRILPKFVLEWLLVSSVHIFSNQEFDILNQDWQEHLRTEPHFHRPVLADKLEMPVL